MTAPDPSARCARCGHDRYPRSGRNGHAYCICHGHGIAGYLPNETIDGTPDGRGHNFGGTIEAWGNGRCVVDGCDCPAFVPPRTDPTKAERLKVARAKRDEAQREWDEAYRAWAEAYRAWEADDKAREAEP